MVQLQSPDSAVRYHAFDGLRALMMLLGIVVHTATSYCTVPLDRVWPFKDTQTSPVFDLILAGIHSFRMPVFFVLAGFFAAMLAHRRGTWGFVRNRAQRVLVPLLVGYLTLLPLANWGMCFAQDTEAGLGSAIVSGFERASRSSYGDSTGHLWFLYYLLIFYAVSVAATRWVPVGLSGRCQLLFAQLMSRRLGLLPFALAVGMACALMPHGTLETSVSFTPSARSLIAYVMFYGFGWFLYGWRGQLHVLRHGLAKKALFAVILAAVYLGCALSSVRSGVATVSWLSLGAAVSGAGLAWVLTSIWLGVFLRYASSPKSLVRYMTDASYWIYLMHLPIVIALAGALAPLSWSVWLKAAVVSGGTLSLCLLTYAFAVRGTIIGVVLNGRRYPSRWGHRLQGAALRSEARASK